MLGLLSFRIPGHQGLDPCRYRSGGSFVILCFGLFFHSRYNIGGECSWRVTLIRLVASAALLVRRILPEPCRKIGRTWIGIGWRVRAPASREWIRREASREWIRREASGRPTRIIRRQTESPRSTSSEASPSR